MLFDVSRVDLPWAHVGERERRVQFYVEEPRMRVLPFVNGNKRRLALPRLVMIVMYANGEFENMYVGEYVAEHLSEDDCYVQYRRGLNNTWPVCFGTAILRVRGGELSPLEAFWMTEFRAPLTFDNRVCRTQFREKGWAPTQRERGTQPRGATR